MSKLTDDELRRIYREVADVNLASPDLRHEIRDEVTQREMIARTIAHLHTKTQPMVLIVQLVAALAFLCDEHRVNREHVVGVFREAQQRRALEMLAP